ELAQDNEHQAQIAQRGAEAAQRRAEAAGQEANRQRDQAERNLQERIVAEQRATAISTAKREVDAELLKSKEQLILERDKANENADKAVHAQVRAESSARRAARAEKVAQTAQAETSRANLELAAALAKEQARVQQLTSTLGSKPITELRRFNRTKKDRL
ncbi:MAG TPA: hypothetical protein VHN14_13700, partial [Kofleriaceae bacterium]|nr:hypothetical protein [Kofleriaceae bacterium]